MNKTKIFRLICIFIETDKTIRLKNVKKITSILVIYQAIN